MHDTAASTRSTDASPACPFHAAVAEADRLSPRDILVFPHHRRSIVQYSSNPNGDRELHIYWDDKHISFDEPDLFAFGETLASTARFAAVEALAWGEGLNWPRVRDLLVQLVDAEVLSHSGSPQAEPPRADTVRPSPLPPAPSAMPRRWQDCETITAELTGIGVEPGHLELIVPIFRVAHIAVDGDGRQVGEANVFPRALRIDVPTEWRTCNLPGSRFQSERPMNVTAMRVMRRHWPQMMAGLLRVRAGYLRRYPDADGSWTVGHLEQLATCVLAVPTYQLMRAGSALGPGDLHPALSSMFRVTDGLRMTMHQMLFVPIGEPTLPPDAPMDVDTILDYAERNYSFHSDHGVCAGPRGMVREFLQVLIEGVGASDYGAEPLEPPVAAAFDELDAAIDYGLLGLQAYAAVFSAWPAMSRTYERLAAIARDAEDSPAHASLRQRLLAHGEALRHSTFLANEAWRFDRDRVYSDMFAQCGRGLGQPGARLDLTPDEVSRIDDTLLRALRRKFGDAAWLSAVATCLAEFLLSIQAVLRAATTVQSRINRHLGRASPVRPFDAVALDVHNLLQGAESRRLPFLVSEIESLLGIAIILTPDTLQVAA